MPVREEVDDDVQVDLKAQSVRGRSGPMPFFQGDVHTSHNYSIKPSLNKGNRCKTLQLQRHPMSLTSVVSLISLESKFCVIRLRYRNKILLYRWLHLNYMLWYCWHCKGKLITYILLNRLAQRSELRFFIHLSFGEMSNLATSLGWTILQRILQETFFYSVVSLTLQVRYFRFNILTNSRSHVKVLWLMI